MSYNVLRDKLNRQFGVEKLVIIAECYRFYSYKQQELLLTWQNSVAWLPLVVGSSSTEQKPL